VLIGAILPAALAALAAGAFSFTGAWPAGLPTGAPLEFQVWIIDAAAVQGLSATNGLQVLSG